MGRIFFYLGVLLAGVICKYENDKTKDNNLINVQSKNVVQDTLKVIKPEYDYPAKLKTH